MKIEVPTQNQFNLHHVRTHHYYFCDCCGKHIEDNAPYTIGLADQEFCKQCAMDIIENIKK